jgi:hypothetical protein
MLNVFLDTRTAVGEEESQISSSFCAAVSGHIFYSSKFSNVVVAKIEPGTRLPNSVGLVVSRWWRTSDT